MQVEFKVKQSEIDKETAYAAFEVERLAKEEVPVDKGILKNSINNIRVGGFKGVRRMVSKITYLIGTNVVYSRYIEFGTPVGTGPNGGPRPFLRPAFRDVVPGYIRAIQRLMRSVR